MDAPQTAGNWSYRVIATGSEAVFAAPTGSNLFSLRCERQARQITLVRHDANGGTAAAMMRILTGTRNQILEAMPLGSDSLATRLEPRDALLDAMIFSRGRFAVETGVLPALYLPSWPEIARTVEDCR